jgi:YD repeat-containing protein
LASNSDQVSSATTPSPEETTTSYYDSSERLVGTQLPDGTYTTNVLLATGQPVLAYGSREYPVGNGYDSEQRLTALTNWTSFLGGAGSRVTTWNYDQYRGWLNSKVYADSTQTAYGYSSAGRLSSRLWARGTNTSYSYNGAGDVASIGYSDSLTPSVGYTYDRVGHKNVISTNSTTVSTQIYNDAGLLLVETNSSGLLTGWSVTNGYDNYMRRMTLVVLLNGTPLWTNIFKYDTASRLASASDNKNSASYSYVANSPMVSQIAFQQSGTKRMTTTEQYDLLNRLTSIGTTNASSVTIASSAYGYNSGNQRTTLTNTDGSYWVYGYDSLGQVISAIKCQFQCVRANGKRDKSRYLWRSTGVIQNVKWCI